MPPLGVPPLRWIAEEPVVYDDAGNELHRTRCSRARAGVQLAPGEALELVSEPRICAAYTPDDVGFRTLTLRQRRRPAWRLKWLS